MFVSFVDLVFGARPANLAVCVPSPLLWQVLLSGGGFCCVPRATGAGGAAVSLSCHHPWRRSSGRGTARRGGRRRRTTAAAAAARSTTHGRRGSTSRTLSRCSSSARAFSCKQAPSNSPPPPPLSLSPPRSHGETERLVSFRLLLPCSYGSAWLEGWDFYECEKALSACAGQSTRAARGIPPGAATVSEMKRSHALLFSLLCFFFPFPWKMKKL